ncbi:MAG: transposase [Acidobacteriota bacterium]
MAAGWQWFADPRERVEIGKRGFFQQVPSRDSFSFANNLAENSMRGVALGRKNWIHVGSPEAGPKVAAIQSVIESAKRLGLPVREYLLEVLPGMAGRKVSAAPAMTPQAWAESRKHG